MHLFCLLSLLVATQNIGTNGDGGGGIWDEEEYKKTVRRGGEPALTIFKKGVDIQKYAVGKIRAPGMARRSPIEHVSFRPAHVCKAG